MAERKQHEDKLADSYDQINTLKAKFEAAQDSIPQHVQKIFDELIAETKSAKETQKQMYNAACEHANKSANELKRMRKAMADMSAQLEKVQEDVSEINTKTDHQTELMFRGICMLGNQLSGITQQLTNNTTNTNPTLPPHHQPLMIEGQQLPNIITAVDNVNINTFPKVSTAADVKMHIDTYVAIPIPPQHGIEGSTVGEAINDSNNIYHNACLDHLIVIYERYLNHNSAEVRDYVSDCLLGMGESDRARKRLRGQ